MRKGLVFALGTIMLFLAGNIGFANAPTFTDVPDIIIGDRELNVAHGLTVDYNFFTYINAFNVLDFASDNDSPVSSLQFVFKETPPDVDDDLMINGIKQIHASSGEFSGDPSTWPGGKDLSGGGTNHWMSFRDIVRSPDLGNDPPTGPAFDNPHRIGGSEVTSTTVEYLPWHNDGSQPGVLALGPGDTPERPKRVVTLFVADEATTASSTFAVFSLNNGLDDLSGGFTTLFPGTTAWTYISYGTTIGQATSSGSPGSFLGLESGAQAGTALSRLFLARWQTTSADGLTQRIPWIPANLIYLARFRLTPNVNSLGAGHPVSKTDLNSIRIGVQDTNGAFILENRINTSNYHATADDVDGQLPDLGVSRDYDLLWSSMADTPNWDNLILSPFDMRTWAVFFDVADLDSNGAADEGLWRLDSFVAGSIQRPPDLDVSAPASQRLLLTDLTTANGFAYETHQSKMDVLQNNPSAGMITFDDQGRSGLPSDYGSFMSWRHLTIRPWLTGKVMRASVQMSCPTTANRDNYHVTRLRHQLVFGNIVQTLFIRQANLLSFGNPGMPIARDGDLNKKTTYEVYVPSWGGPTAFLQSLSLADWLVSLDQVQNTLAYPNVNNPTQVTFHQILYEILDEPSGP